MDASDWAAAGAASVLGFIIIHVALWGFWINMRNEIRAARAEIRAAGVRVADVELERARMKGVMSVMQPQAHAHESAGTRPNSPAGSQSAPPSANR